MSLFHQASDLNNKAIVALSKGHDKLAVQSLTESIKIFRQDLSKTDSCESSSTLREMKQVSNSSTTGLKTITIPILSSSSYDEHHDIFNHAIHIPCNGHESEMDIQVHVATVIFNLALAHHRQSVFLGGGNKNNQCQLKAMKLYTMSLRVVDDSLLEHQTALMIKLAAINNLAQIRFSIGEDDEAREGLRRLADLARLANDSLLAEPRAQSLLYSLLWMRAPNVAAAA